MRKLRTRTELNDELEMTSGLLFNVSRNLSLSESKVKLLEERNAQLEFDVKAAREELSRVRVSAKRDLQIAVAESIARMRIKRMDRGDSPFTLPKRFRATPVSEPRTAKIWFPDTFANSNSPSIAAHLL